MRLYNRHAAIIAALMAMGGAVSCGVATPDEQTETDAPVEPAQAPSAGEAGKVTGLRAAYIAAVQSGAGEEYHAERGASGEAVLVHPPQRFAATLDGARVRVTQDEEEGWELTLATTAVGCETRPGALLPAGIVEASKNRVHMSRGDVEEWYVNGPLGLEQGFTLERAPSCAGTKVVSIEVGGDLVPGLVHAEGSEKGTAVTFSSPGGGAVARYSDLHVKDARGKILDAWMTLAGTTIELHVDDAEAVYPIEIDPLVAVQSQKITASDAQGHDFFGISAAISGDTAVIGAREEDAAGTNAGAAYVFVRSGGVWTEQQKLISVGTVSGRLGEKVAIDGDTIVCGARTETIGSNGNQGAAYVFTRSGTTWTQQQRLWISDGATSDFYGGAVSISGDTIAVGAVGYLNNPGAPFASQNRGAVYVYTRSGSVWSLQQKLAALDGLNEEFGQAVALQANTLLIGSTLDSIGGINGGSVFVFTRSGTTWTEQFKIWPSDPVSYASFGGSISLSGNTALVGARYHSTSRGAAYVFTNYSGLTWIEEQKLLASDGATSDAFGSSVSLLGDVALIGASGDTIGATTAAGSAYLFKRSGTTWAEEQKITASDPGQYDRFGGGVALGTDVAIVGASDDNIGASPGYQGSAYVFGITDVGGGGSACTTAGECGSGFCVDGYCCDTACGGGSTSDCQACSVTAGAAENGTCAPIPTGSICRTSGGVCDVAEACDGTSTACPSDAKVASSTTCRAAVQPCDVPESCDGENNACPADEKLAAGTLCRAADGPCDVADHCDGVSAACTADAKVASGTTCRASAGGCDPAESCNGVSNQCPADTLLASGTVCRASTGSCDPAEVCDGASAACPTDVSGGSCGTPVCVTIRRGVNGAVADSYLSSVNGGWGPGAEPWMTTGGTGVGRGLLRFDLGSIPSGATVTSATVTLYAGWNTSNTTVRAHKVLNSWAESTVSYNNFWSSSNFDAAVSASFPASGVGNKTFSITSLAAEWVTGAAPNYGILLEEDIGVSPPIGRHTFYCSEGSTMTQRPKLEICYLQ